MEFSRHQLEIAQQLSKKELDREVRVYQRLDLSYLCPLCREFLGTNDYKEFTKRRKKWIYEVRGVLSGGSLKLDLGSPSVSEFWYALFFILILVVTLLVSFWTKIYALLGLLPVVLIIGGGVLFDKIRDRRNPVKTKVRWIKKGKVRSMLFIGEGHAHREFRDRGNLQK